MNLYLGNYWYLLLLLLVPLLGYVFFRFKRWKQHRQNIFAETRFREELFRKRSGFANFFPVLYLLASLFLILSIVDLLGGSEEVETNQKMNNVIFMLDVSNSMNAQDVEENRLSQAKNIIVNTMQRMTNDKVGIVVFAGEAASIMPLTTDFTAAETYIGGIDTNVVKIQGTDFLKAMQTAAIKFKNIAKGSRKVVLLSDGEDNEGNDKPAARLAKKEGITIVSVGIGTEEGAPIPEYVFGQLMGYKSGPSGQTVISKRQSNALINLASDTGGSYVDGNNMESAVVQIGDALAKTGGAGSTMVKSQNAVHYYQYFLGLSIFFFLIIYLLNPRQDLNI
ncbi:vWA domain-containing protein [Kaistella rhinocerotis]|uniref:vWA domain-containing protein n=1 Tax=Kaistella rhinocerotis TaxID=3026437 RepID=UPI0025544D2A|nr:VWA domain-containing protein [Kaistella sp. Ran72]